MGTVLLIDMTVWLVGAALLWLTARLTRGIHSPWLRQLPRAVVAALVFTPSLVHLLHVRVLFPALAVLLFEIFKTGRIDALGWLFVVLPIVAVFIIVWVASSVISSIGQRHRAVS